MNAKSESECNAGGELRGQQIKNDTTPEIAQWVMKQHEEMK